MSYAKPMLDSHPHEVHLDPDLLASAIEASLECAQACTACADACLWEDRVADLRKCIGLDLDCADVCAATARVLSRQPSHSAAGTVALLDACRAVCRSCGDECESHADMHEHCRVCAEACRRCEGACQELATALA